FFFFGRRKFHGRTTRTKRPKGPSRSSRQPGRPGLAMGATASTQRYCKMGGKLGLLEQGPAAAHPSQSSGTCGLPTTASDGRNQVASPRPLRAANSQTLWLKAHCNHYG